MSSSESSDIDLNSEYNTTSLKGEILNNKYILIESIGNGSFATVWLSLNIQNNKYYAIKIQNVEDFESGIEEIEIFRKLATSKCKYINSMIENFKYNVDEGVHICMVFELMAGSLYDIIRIGKYKNGLPLNVVKTIMKQLLTSLDIINNKHNILHSDIKPENILVVGTSNKMLEIINLFKNNKQIIACLNNKNKINKKNIKDIINSISFDSINKKYSKYSTNNTDELEIIDDKFIQNIHVKLSDFGNCKDINYSYFDIQTRYYRAPEIILGIPYTTGIDMWSSYEFISKVKILS